MLQFSKNNIQAVLWNVFYISVYIFTLSKNNLFGKNLLQVKLDFKKQIDPQIITIKINV